MRRLPRFIAPIVAAAVLVAPAAASAISFEIGIVGEGVIPLTFQGEIAPTPSVTGVDPRNGGTLTTTLPIAGTYSGSECEFEGCGSWTVRISNIGTLPSQQARIIATDSPTTDTVKLTGTLITFVAGDPSFDVRILYTHDFLNAPLSAATYGLNLTETFGRRVGGLPTTAIGDGTTLVAEAGFRTAGAANVFVFEEIGTIKTHLVGVNSFGPSPSTEAISCVGVEAATDIDLRCQLGGERIQTTAFLDFDVVGDTLRVANTWVTAGECETVGACEQAIALAAVPAPGTLLLLGVGLAAVPFLGRRIFRR